MYLIRSDNAPSKVKLKHWLSLHYLEFVKLNESYLKSPLSQS
jgi:hypothetical protein